MGAYTSPSSPRKRASWIVCLAQSVYRVFSELNYAGKRAAALRLSYGLAEFDQAPDTYAEFLLRSSTAVRHEPPARSRACGRQVK